MVQAIDKTQNIWSVSHAEVEKAAEIWRNLPEDVRNRPLPDTHEMHEAVARLFIGMYGDALKELAKR